LGGWLAALTQKQLIAPDGVGFDGDDAYRFRHVLIRDAAYARLTKLDRAQLHAAFAAWLASVAADRIQEYVEIQAHHLAAAVEYRLELGVLDSADSELVSQALTGLLESAQRSERVFAHLDAAAAYDRALRLLDALPASLPRPANDPVELLDRRAEALGRAGLHGDAADAAAVAVDALGDADPIRRALLEDHLAAHLWSAGDESGALNAVQAGIEMLDSRELDPAAGPVRARLLAARARLLMVARRPEAGLAAIEATAAARQSGDDEALVSALISQAVVIGRQDPTRGIELLEAGRSLAVAQGDIRAVLRADVNLGVLLFARADFEALRIHYARALRVATDHGLEGTTTSLYYNMAGVELADGRPREARQLLQRALELETTGDDAIGLESALGVALAMEGQISQGLDRLEAACRRARRKSQAETRIQGETDLGWALWLDGRLEEALVQLRDPVITGSAWPEVTVRRAVYEAQVHASLAVRSRQADDREAEDTAIAAMLEVADEALAAWSREPDDGDWAIDRALALLPGELARGRGADEISAWQAVATELNRLKDWWFEAYARWRLSEALVEAGHPQAEVIAAIDSGRKVAERAQAGGLVRALDALRVQIGGAN
jgi:tetratricopeptide (TPR) repeat protein